VWPGEIFLPTIHTILDPGAASLSRLVVAVFSLPDDSFKPLLADRAKEVEAVV
jgi:hypothetical protein